jgi:hypothetical protein
LNRLFSTLDLLKSSTPITTAKISNKLRELAFKLDVEKKLKAGSERLAVLYRNDPSMGDKKNRAGVHGELLESNEKIVLLKRALKKYQQLFVPGMEDDGKWHINFFFFFFRKWILLPGFQRDQILTSMDTCR